MQQYHRASPRAQDDPYRMNNTSKSKFDKTSSLLLRYLPYSFLMVKNYV
jgi:hypothetical protein